MKSSAQTFHKITYTPNILVHSAIKFIEQKFSLYREVSNLFKF